MSDQVEKAMNYRLNIQFVSGKYQYLYPKTAERAQELLKQFSDGVDYLTETTFIKASSVTHISLDVWEKRDYE